MVDIVIFSEYKKRDLGRKGITVWCKILVNEQWKMKIFWSITTVRQAFELNQSNKWDE